MTSMRNNEFDGLSAPGLSCYVEAVAGAIGLSPAGIGSEIADTATAYIALTARSSALPDRDLMLAWTDTAGWVLATEPARPGQAPVVLARLTGDVLPTPSTVARFVAMVLAGQHVDQAPGTLRGPATELADRLAGYHRPPHPRLARII
ncbi:hypothetical protein F0L68_16435 [Solihabitans fulvus]|uniref:DUF6292 domain-containing protein n=1 Tax=Solihabitans fulvus TaxID=1892852 RepID=A0A5B2XDG3_9PSEU|nr:DUF6292 family protein [Solihabitans fulvus]KAA2261383.1 hypothetical protein F0L68_16435 [Solihabitans fulvus]